MSSFEWNKIIASILTAMIIAMVSGILAGQLVRPKPLEKAVFLPAGSEQVATASAQQGSAAGPEPIEPLLAKADVGRGEEAAKKCGACHTFTKGGAKLVGPNLWGVVGRPKASMADYNYSAALKGKGGQWTVDDLNQFIANPKGMVPGTNMTFSGVPRAGERADIIVYLNMQSDNPVPLPRASLSSPTFAAR